MQDKPRRLTTIEPICLQKTVKSRKSLQMAVLTIHHQPKKAKKKQFKVQTQDYCSNRLEKSNQINRIHPIEINILQTIRSRINYQKYKNIKGFVSTPYQNPNINDVLLRNFNFNKQRSTSSYSLFQDQRMQKLRHRFQKIEIKKNINLLTRKKQKNSTQRVLAKLDQMNQENLSQSLSCRQMLVHRPRLCTSNKDKHNQFRSKIAIKSSWRQKYMSKSLQTKTMQGQYQNNFQGWKTAQKQEQASDFRYQSKQSLT